MNDTNAGNAPRPYWFVGASYGGTKDQTSRFLEEGIWENGYDDKYQDLVREMQPGERIAIKATFTRKHDLPFDNRGNSVSVMQIKATGTITENLNDGKRVRVDWMEQDPPLEWYFYTYLKTVWRVPPGKWMDDNLIAFAFEGEPQNITRFRNEPYWRDRFGDRLGEQPQAADGADMAASSMATADETESPEGDDGEDDRSPESARDGRPFESYSVDDILRDGCFLEKDEVEGLLDLLREKKNLILQGPPGTGKTWMATRLAFALMERKDRGRIRRVQFHPNLSYEDFVRGWRPSGDGKLVIEDGVFMKAVRQASEDPSSKLVVVIEEVNRGNPAQIFGELLTLLEADKRTPEAAVELCYPDADGKRQPVHVPGNLYVIGTMNTADRSLALIDFAFRRRFAFAALEPKLGDKWHSWVIAERGVDGALAREIEHRIVELNQGIAGDGRLGDQFRIGHSFVTPVRRLGDGETRGWFEKIVKSEIGPQLEEYWFDSPETAKAAIGRLLEGW